MRRALTPFEQRLATAIQSADQLRRMLQRERVPGFVVSIAMGEEAIAEARYLTAVQTLYGFPVMEDEYLMPNQITVRASTNIA